MAQGRTRIFLSEGSVSRQKQHLKLTFERCKFIEKADKGISGTDNKKDLDMAHMQKITEHRKS